MSHSYTAISRMIISPNMIHAELRAAPRYPRNPPLAKEVTVTPYTREFAIQFATIWVVAHSDAAML